MIGRSLIEEIMAQERCRREPHWTESVVVGSQAFVEQISEAVQWRSRFEIEPVLSEGLALKEEAADDCLHAKNGAGNCA